MANLDFGTTPLVVANDNKILSPVRASANFADEVRLTRALSALQRGPVHIYRGKVIVCDGDAANYLFFVVSGVVRSCKVYKNGDRIIGAFYLPGELFGWTDRKHSLSLEAATDALVLFLKRSALLSLACRNSRVASTLLSATTNELQRTQEHIMLMSKMAKCRVAAFLADLWMRLGKGEYLDVPMSYQDIADYLGLTIETLSRSITDMERSGLISRVSGRKLLVRNGFALGHMRN